MPWGALQRGPTKILVGWAAVHLASPIICLLGEISTGKIGATRCQILRPKYTNFAFRWDSAPDLAGKAYSVPTAPLAVFYTEGEGEGKREENKCKGEGRGGEVERRIWLAPPPKKKTKNGMAPLWYMPMTAASHIVLRTGQRETSLRQ